jgi:hypothetical protein
MDLTEIAATQTPFAIPNESELSALFESLGPFPGGYADYMRTLGEGILGGTYVRVYPPWRIQGHLAGWRRRIEEYWFWSGLSQQRGLECVLFADTVDGDELVFHPSDPEEVWVLPRHFDEAWTIGRGLWQALEWLCTAGILVEPFADRRFEPFDSRLGNRVRSDA